MYYEEKMIDGILNFKNSPKEDFKPFSLEALSQRIIDLKNELENVNVELERAYYQLDSMKAING